MHGTIPWICRSRANTARATRSRRLAEPAASGSWRAPARRRASRQTRRPDSAQPSDINEERQDPGQKRADGSGPAAACAAPKARRYPIIAPTRHQRPTACPHSGGNADARTGGQRQCRRRNQHIMPRRLIVRRSDQQKGISSPPLPVGSSAIETRPAHDGAGDSEPLALAARQRGRAHIPPSHQPDPG